MTTDDRPDPHVCSDEPFGDMPGAPRSGGAGEPAPAPPHRIRIRRRRFLGGAAALGTTAAFGGGLFDAAAIAAGVPAASAAGSPVSAKVQTGAGTLVVVTLYGGNDGLNMVVPSESAYLSARGAVGWQPSETLPLGGGMGLNPQMPGLKAMWDAKQLAIVRGVGYPNPDHSHFRSMDIWQSAVPDRFEPTGWLGRWLDVVNAAGRDPFRALAIGPSVPRLLVGANGASASVPTGNLNLPKGKAMQAALAKLAAVDGSRSPLAAAVAASDADLLGVAAGIDAALAKVPAPATPPTGTSDLGRQLCMVARLIQAGIGTSVFSVSMGGFDTHAGEKTTHATLMGRLDTAIAGFFAQLGTVAAQRDVVVLVHSEFGRRVGANAGGGTDHGTANPVLVAGPNVTGGFVGDQPSCADLVAGDLKVTTDFRRIYATMLASVLGADPVRILGGTFASLPLRA